MWFRMFFNSVQNFDSWNEFFDSPSGAQLGLLVALYQIGSVVSIPLVPIITDNWGRRLSIAIGFVIMIVGAIMQGACQDYGSKLKRTTSYLSPFPAMIGLEIKSANGRQRSPAVVSSSALVTPSLRSPRPCFSPRFATPSTAPVSPR